MLAATNAIDVFPFDNSYARLPERFFVRLPPTPVAAPQLIRLNEALARHLRLDPEKLASSEGVAVLVGNRVPHAGEPLAMAYAGHQFGAFVPQLGDGRAILLGEVVDADGVRRDIQLKGSGPTPFSRNGDGRAALGPVLREYIVSADRSHLRPPATIRAARKARAEAMGFDTRTTWYRTFPELSLGTGPPAGGDGVMWVTDKRTRASASLASGGRPVAEGARVAPVYIRAGDLDVWAMAGESLTEVREEIEEAVAWARANGSAGIIFENLRDVGGPSPRPVNVAAIFDPAAIRSVQADFDPEQVGSADLMAATGGGGIRPGGSQP
jgi:hypothetical protein